MKIALTIEQMKTLINLGVDVSNAQFSYVCGGLKWLDRACRETTEMDCMPALTLTDLLEMLPPSLPKLNDKGCPYLLDISRADNSNLWFVGYESADDFNSKRILIDNVNLIDALYELVIWCVEHGYIETK